MRWVQHAHIPWGSHVDPLGTAQLWLGTACADGWHGHSQLGSPSVHRIVTRESGLYASADALTPSCLTTQYIYNQCKLPNQTALERNPATLKLVSHRPTLVSGSTRQVGTRAGYAKPKSKQMVPCSLQ